MDEQRLIDLEIKVSHQEATIDALHQIVYDHQKTIERMESRLASLASQFESAVGDGQPAAPADEKPPHY